MTPDEIYAESFRIIETEAAGHPFDAIEWPIVRRMIHASGDLEILRSVVFAHDAAALGIAALRAKVPIVADVSMVAAGIDKPRAKDLGVEIHCFIDDPGVRELAIRKDKTRSACAIEKAIAEIGNAVYVVGNAPTALFTLCDAVLQGIVRPPLILAMPVGFVSVVESKERALVLPNVPIIAVRGRKGGSAVASASVNALLRAALEERDR